MQARGVALLIGLAAVLGGDGGSSQSFEWWTTDALDKVKPLDAIPDMPSKLAELYAGRNEFEPFQIVLRGHGKELPDIDVDVSDLRTQDGSEISKRNVAVYFESYMNVTVPSSVEGAIGLWPDALIPRVDRFAGEKRNAFPFPIRPGHNQPIWIEVFVPETARPGKYSGTVQILAGGKTQASVPVHLTVWSFTLPVTSTLKSSFGFNGVAALKQHRGRYTDDEDLQSLTRAYAQDALQHRLTLHGGSMQYPKFSYRGAKMQLDWRDYDDEMTPFMNGTSIPESEPLHGARATSAEIRMPNAFENDEIARSYWTEWTKHFQQKGWADRLFLYLWDEPKPGDLPAVLKKGRVAMQSEPRPRALLTTPFTPMLADVVQIWVPLVNCLEAKPGFADFCAEAPPLDAYSQPSQKGKSLWFYQSCASHGCNIIGGSYFTGWPNYIIDVPGTANRVMQWIGWKYRVEGELYFSMDESWGAQKDPWSNVRLFGGNGDGTLFYPGRTDRIGGRTDIPIESIRLKLIREGMEDYEYLALLARLEGRKAADDFAGRIVRKPWQWESRRDVFLNIRRQLGEELDRVSRSEKSN